MRISKVLLLVLFLITSCLPVQKQQSLNELSPELKKIEIYNASASEKNIIYLALSIMTKEVQESVEFVSINDDSKHYAIKSVKGEIAGHFELKTNPANPEKTLTGFCLKSTSIRADVINHEASHCFEYRRQPELGNRWKEIAGDVYVNKNTVFDVYHLDPSYHKQGVLSQYGSRNHREDFSEWVEEIYKARREEDSAFIYIKDKKDPRYFAKLELLRNEKAISEEDYKFIKNKYFKN